MLPTSNVGSGGSGGGQSKAASYAQDNAINITQQATQGVQAPLIKQGVPTLDEYARKHGAQVNEGGLIG